MDLSLIDAALMPVIVGLVEAVKKAGVSHKWLPAIAVLFGIIGVWAMNGQEAQWLGGIAMGLGAVGLYDGTKSTLK